MATSSDKDARWDGLVQLAKTLPENPGVYIMKNAAGNPIYIGKAVNLRSRVRSYFSDRHEDRAQIPIMLQQLDNIEWIATNTESEALILEANLIRKHIPRYNIDLRDDKHYPYLKVTAPRAFPAAARRTAGGGGRRALLRPLYRRCRHAQARGVRQADLQALRPEGSAPYPDQQTAVPQLRHAPLQRAAPGRSRPADRDQIAYLLQFLSGKRNGLLADL